MIRKAYVGDKTAVLTIIQDAIADMESKGIHQWDSVYPNEEIIDNDMGHEQLYVYANNGIKGIMVLNESQEREYESISWKFNTGRQLIVHRLCVDPRFQGQGIARQLMKYAEDHGKRLQYGSIRLDAFIDNGRACNLYERLGYTKAGIVNFRKGKFYCFEKKL